MKRFSLWLAMLALVAFLPTAHAVDFPHPDRIRYDGKGFQIEGKDVFIYGGAFHYFRTPKAQWRDRFQKIKDAGFNTVETYVAWNYHERKAPSGPGDYSNMDLSELEAWIRMAEEFGFYIIIRPGPYICAEWAGGGYPQWLVPTFKPKDWPADKVWLQTDDPAYLAWNKHWYDAVARVVAPHQITRKPPGSPGVIMVQVENEYNRLRWLPKSVKINHLAALSRQIRAAGIDVLIISCWTTETRGSDHPDLADVVDFVNSYPRWNVRRQIDSQVKEQRRDAPDKPLGAMELQGGWYSDIGGQLSERISGVDGVQTQNLTLYVIQTGYSVINYYMLHGGTNFDDWASRDTTTTYDYDAAIREHGGVGDKWARLAGIGQLIREHGARLIRSELVLSRVELEDDQVEVAVRRAPDGTTYIFVRTEDRGAEHTGVARVMVEGVRYVVRYALERFGSQVLVLPPGVNDAARGQWLPRRAAEPARPAAALLPQRFDLVTAQRAADMLPTEWTPLPPGSSLELMGVVGHHPVYYRVSPGAAGLLQVGRIGERVIAATMADGVRMQVGDDIASEASGDASSVSFNVGANVWEAILLQERIGLHHHTTPKLEQAWASGLGYARLDGSELPMEFASTERQRGIELSTPQKANSLQWREVRVAPNAPPAPDALINWYRFEFSLPQKKAGVWVPWQFLLEAMGNGFLYLNGEPIGRTWEVGPQREFYLPESLLRFGPGQKNVLTVSLVSRGKGVSVRRAALVPANDYAEVRPAGR